MNIIEVELVDMPESIRGCTIYTGERAENDFYRILINSSLSENQREITLKHEKLHIEFNHFKSGITASEAEDEVKTIMSKKRKRLSF